MRRGAFTAVPGALADLRVSLTPRPGYTGVLVLTDGRAALPRIKYGAGSELVEG